MIKHLLYTVLFVFVLACSAFTQEFEYGRPAELKGLTDIYIDVGSDLESYDRIRGEIEKAKLRVKFLDTADGADLVIAFKSDRQLVRVGNATHRKRTGQGWVAIPSANSERLRILISFDEMQDKIGEKKPAVRFAREFVKAYKTANELE